MSAGLTKTKRRIASVTSTKKITKAMELVATVKLKKWKDKMENNISYLKMMEDIILSCVKDVDTSSLSELNSYKNATKTLYVVVTSSLGLCGGYNYNLFKFLNTLLKKDDKVLLIGTKGLTKIDEANNEIEDDFVSILDHFSYQSVSKLCTRLKEEYATGEYKEVKLVTTLYNNSLTFIPVAINIFPFGGIDSQEESKEEIKFEPSKQEVLELLVPKYLSTLLYSRLTEAMVCEQASRRNAMDTATDNATELSEKLKIEYNKARQAAITQEITEVVGGANNK